MHCYEVLWNCVRFMRAVPSPRKRAQPLLPDATEAQLIGDGGTLSSDENAMDDEGTGGSDGETRLQRPKGKKRAQLEKKEASIDRSMAHSQRRLARATTEQVGILKEQLQVAKQKIRIMQEQSEMAIMTAYKGDLTEYGAKYILLRQKRHLDAYKRQLEQEDCDAENRPAGQHHEQQHEKDKYAENLHNQCDAESI
ncbi:hypothetical protein V7S43_006642 [Phytophthora oleae]|uniref:No apical meristem-associated C-terminal domain-containing protein n=1 Tax=Phytophthora oleae TaxID=2107226 RepID=A0ABD3FSE7_9STRA